MRPKSILLLALALGCGLVASIGISQVMDRRSGDQGPPPTATEAIFVAATDVNVADSFTEEFLKFEEWPKDKIPPDAMTVLEDIVGRRPRTKIYAGEPIREAKLMREGESPDETIPKGYRAFPVRVNAESGTAGLVKPGGRVDVQLYVKKNAALGVETMVKTILEDVKVFAVDQHYRRAGDGEESHIVARTISLLVTPQQAMELSLADELGKLRLVLRHPDDDTASLVTSVNISDLLRPDKSDRESEREGFGKERTDFTRILAQAQPAPATEVALGPGPWIMTIIEADQMRQLKFPEDGSLPVLIDGSSSQPPAAAPSADAASMPEAPAAPTPEPTGPENNFGFAPANSD